MIQITRQGTVFSDVPATVEMLSSQFERHHYFRIPQLLEPELLDSIQRQIDGSEFRERVHEGIESNKELCMTGNAAFGTLLFLINDERLFQIIQDITLCNRIRCFEGRIYRVNPGCGHHDVWHNDLGDDRLVGLSINLSNNIYDGGVLQIRECASGEIVSQAENVVAGDAIVFSLSPSLQHRITDVEGKVPKTAFAGWFRAQPDFASLIKEQAERGMRVEKPGRDSYPNHASD